MSEKGRKQKTGNNRNGMRFNIKAPTASEVKAFRDEVERCIDDLDFAMQTFSQTLVEAGYTSKDVEKELQRVFWDRVKMIRGLC